MKPRFRVLPRFPRFKLIAPAARRTPWRRRASGARLNGRLKSRLLCGRILGRDGLRTTITVNGEARSLDLDPRTTLLDALRETLKLTGAKKGCDHGQCGACTVLVNGVQ